MFCRKLRIQNVLSLLLTHATKPKQLLYVRSPLLLCLVSKGRLLAAESVQLSC